MEFTRQVTTNTVMRDERQHPEDRRVGGNAVEPERAAELLDVLENHADDFAEAERDEREVIALEPQRRDADEQAGQRGAESAGEQARRRRSPPWCNATAAFVAEKAVGAMNRLIGGGEIRADGHEAGVAERELAGVAVHQIQRDGEDDVDPDADQDVEVVRIDVIREMRNAERDEQRGEQGEMRLGMGRSGSDQRSAVAVSRTRIGEREVRGRYA